MRVVVDANVYVSAAITKGSPHRILLEWDEQAPPVITPSGFETLLGPARQ